MSTKLLYETITKAVCHLEAADVVKCRTVVKQNWSNIEKLRTKSILKIALLEAAQPTVHTLDQMVIDTYGHVVVC